MNQRNQHAGQQQADHQDIDNIKQAAAEGFFNFGALRARSVFVFAITVFLLYQRPLPLTFWLILLVIITRAKLTMQLNIPTAVL